MILACHNINKSFGTSKILENVSFHVNENEKAAVIGVNGAGKSTLFKIIMNEISSDDGSVTLSKGSSIGYLSQHGAVSSKNTIYQEMISVKSDLIKLEEAIRQLEKEMKTASANKLDQMLESYSRLTHEFESQNGYAYKSEVVGVLKGLGFAEDEFNKSINTLSGGEKTRVALGKLLLSNPDLLLLDEPTNHLDLESIAWLETFLANYNGAVLLIAHDRYFLDKIVTKIIEIEHRKAKVFNGDYSTYAQQKSVQRETLLKHYINQEKEIKRQEEVIRKLRSFNREKSIKRAQSREKMLNKMERIDKPYEFDSSMTIHFEPQITSGNDVLSVNNLSKSFSKLTLFKDISFDIKRGEHVAIIGNNGTGKTTILKIINNLLEADEGNIKLGENVKIGYYDQEQKSLNLENTIFDEIQDTYPHLNNTSVRNILASFLFTGDDVFKQIKELSGGERGRVSLAKLMLSESNFLIMDEPTNHLDITSKEILENAINKYTGTVLYVSHDRYFINKTASRILELTNQSIINYLGNYDYYLEKKPDMENLLLSKTSNNSQNDMSKSLGADLDNTSGKQDWLLHKEEQARLRKIQNELDITEKKISKLEERSQEIDHLLTHEEVYTNVEKLINLNNEKKEIEKELEVLLDKWEELSQIID
ncbi:MAG: ABC-F family ATP-binding cassette domain-containing protein [Epulopiscium sp.]|nr:ABC-F family ATP-binding cassette domain-containing protein [Candidatus Epulonipiscium sp.]